MQIISTCRPGARIAGSGRISKHASGEAIDFNAGRRKGEGGVGGVTGFWPGLVNGSKA